MKRGELYRVYKPHKREPKEYRVFVVIGRQAVIDSQFSTVICAPVYSRYDGLSTQVPVGPPEGLKHESAIHCDELVSLPKSSLTHFVGTLSPQKLKQLHQALRIAVDIENPH